MKRRGIVMELGKVHAIVMTPDGDFCRIPRAGNMDVGLEVDFEDEMMGMPVTVNGRNRWRKQSRRLRSVASGIAAAAVIGAGVWAYNGIMHPPAAYAYVSLDVNPSVSLQVDKNLTVQEATGTDPDGQKMVSALHLKGLALSKATSEVLAYADTHHYLAPQSGILVAVTAVQTNTKAEVLSAAAKKAVDTAIASNQAVEALHPAVYAVAVPETIWKAASDAHISPGRLMSVLVAAQEGETTGLMNVQGTELAHVWSNPMAKEAALKIGTGDSQQLTRVLQSLSELAQQGGTSSSGKSKQNAASNAAGSGTDVNSTNQSDTNGQSGPLKSDGNNGHGQGQGGNPGKGVANTLEGAANALGSFANSMSNQMPFGAGNDASQNGTSNQTVGFGHAIGKQKDSQQGSDNGTGRGVMSGQSNASGDGQKGASNNRGTQSNKSGKGSKHQYTGQNRGSNDIGRSADGSGNGSSSKNGKDHGRDGRNGNGGSNGSSQNTISIHVGDKTFNIPLNIPQSDEGDHQEGDN